MTTVRASVESASQEGLRGPDERAKLGGSDQAGSFVPRRAAQPTTEPYRCPCLEFQSSPKSRYVCTCGHVSDEHVQKGMSRYAIFGACESRRLRP